MLLRLLPLIAGLLPIAAIHGSYALAIQADLVPSCIPYVDGCTSISSTGRHPPASYLFKAAMLPQSVLLVAFWVVSAAWLRALERHAAQPGRSGVAIATLGCGGALALILYVTFLGTSEPFYEFMRRFGVYLYFALSVFAQLGLAWKARRCAQLLDDAMLVTLTGWQLTLSVVPFLIGVTNLLLKAVLEDPDAVENVIEWVFALLMQIYFLLAWATWRRTRFGAHFEVAPQRKR